MDCREINLSRMRAYDSTIPAGAYIWVTDDFKEEDHNRNSDGTFKEMNKTNLKSTKRNVKVSQEDFFIVPRSLGAVARTFYVKNAKPLKETGLYLQPGTRVTGVKEIVIGDKIRMRNKLSERYLLPNGQKVNPNGWKKLRATATITNGKVTYKNTEIHYYQADSIGKVEFKVKRWGDKDES